MMFYCNECDEFFEELEKVEETIGEYCGQPATEIYCVCPMCRESNFEKATRCEICGNWAKPYEYCETCQEEYPKYVKDFFGKFNDKEKEYIKDLILEYIEDE